MLEILKYIFSNVWIFLGTLILIAVLPAVILDGIADIVRAWKHGK